MNLTLNGQNLSVRQWAANSGISPSIIYRRLSRNWPLDRALMTPSQGHGGTYRGGGPKATLIDTRRLQVLHAEGLTARQIGERFNVSRDVIIRASRRLRKAQ